MRLIDVFLIVFGLKMEPCGPEEEDTSQHVGEGAAHYWFWVFSCRISPDWYLNCNTDRL